MTAYDDEEAPLDPAAERLRRKLTRLLFVSVSVMALGLIAVFAAIVYKLGAFGPDDAGRTVVDGFASGATIEAALPLPAGASLVAAALDGRQALLTVETDSGATSLMLVDLTTGRVLGRYALQPE